MKELEDNGHVEINIADSGGLNPKISEIRKNIESLNNIDLFNELNTPYEKLELDKIKEGV